MIMKLQKAVALRMSNLLIKKGMSQYALSLKSGLTKQAIANIINEKYNSIKFDTVIKIADGFNMSVQEFLNDYVFKRVNLDID